MMSLKFTIVTPSFNQAQFLPDNLRSVSSQKGVEVEHIIVDPGSTDGSTAIARQADHAILINEPDRGQSHGITKGYERSTGDILVWLNSDDFYPDDNVLFRVERAFKDNPEADIIYGNVNFVDEKKAFLRKGFVNKDSEGLLDSFQYQVGIVQPGVFMRRRVFEAVGGPSEDFNYCMDYEYWVRKASAGFKWTYINDVLAHHRWWPGMKTASGRRESIVEHFKVCAKYFGYIHHKWLERYGEFAASQCDGVVNHSLSTDIGVKEASIKLAIRRFFTQDMLALLEKSEDKHHRETLTYLKQYASEHIRTFFPTADLGKHTSIHADPDAEKRVAWHVFNTSVDDGRRFKTYTVPNNFSRSVNADWLALEHEKAKERLARLAERRKDVCVIVANGPSLNKSNLDLLGHADVMISNFAFISKALRSCATYLTFVNDLVAREGSVHFNDINIFKVIPFWLGNSINPTDTTAFVPATVVPTFCKSIDGTFSWRSTVSFFNMQLAYALGYEKVVLIGFDHFYQQPPGLKEGQLIIQNGDDQNHFDPRYFKGKPWQAASTDNMEEMYLLAHDAYKTSGRAILNATVGGRLDIFPRCSLEEGLGLMRQRPPKKDGNQLIVPARSGYTLPRLLVLDMTATGDRSATGEMKANLLAGWPADRLLQVARHGQDNLAIVRPDEDGWVTQHSDAATLRRMVSDFAPDVILYRPVPEAQALHALAMTLIRDSETPLVTWIMDDWPARMAAEDPEGWSSLGPDLVWLIERSSLCLSICEDMSEAFVRRYGKPFVPLANGVDPADWAGLPPREDHTDSFVLRYAGGAAIDMNRASLFRIAQAVERIAAGGGRIRFEISTQPWWKKQIEGDLAKFAHTHIELADRSMQDYRQWLAQADANLIAYNFDEASLRYIRTSFGNKTPDCMAAGVPILAHGPLETATIGYLAAGDCAAVVSEESLDALVATISKLMADRGLGAEIGARARERAFAEKNIHDIRQTFRGFIDKSSATRLQRDVRPVPSPVRGAGTTILQLAAHLLTTESSDVAGRLRALVAQAGSNDPAARHAAAVLGYIERKAGVPRRGRKRKIP